MMTGSRPDAAKRWSPPIASIATTKPHDVDWGLLQNLLIVVESGSFRAGAKRHSLNTVRKRVAMLERMTGQQLVECTVTGVKPTPAGERFIAQVRLMRQTLEAHLAAERNHRLDPDS